MEELRIAFTVLGSVIAGWVLNEISYAFRERQKSNERLNNALSILLPMRFSLALYVIAKKHAAHRISDSSGGTSALGARIDADPNNAVSFVSTNAIVGWAKEVAVLFGESAQKAVAEVGAVDPVLAHDLYCSVSAVYMFFGVEKKASLEYARILSVLGIPEHAFAQGRGCIDAPDVPDGVLVSFDRTIKAIARRAGLRVWLRIGKYLKKMSPAVPNGVPSGVQT
jgi:hypothetical protein